MPNGVHHVALFTGQMDETVRFWTSVLRARLVRTGADADEPGSRHYYFDVGGTLVAFFEFPAQPDKDAMTFGWMHHLALRAESESALEALRRHIESFSVPVSEVRERDFLKSIYLHDNNGIMIEIAYQHRPFTDEDFKNDPRPVLAVKEMLAG
jgi:glyoxalase family protein